MRRTLLTIRYEDEAGVAQEIQTKIKTLQTRNKAEYLITENDLSIRLDKVLQTEPI